jgi:hypothetical protein
MPSVEPSKGRSEQVLTCLTSREKFANPTIPYWQILEYLPNRPQGSHFLFQGPQHLAYQRVTAVGAWSGLPAPQILVCNRRKLV